MGLKKESFATLIVVAGVLLTGFCPHEQRTIKDRMKDIIRITDNVLLCCGQNKTNETTLFYDYFHCNNTFTNCV